jgi:hypothetical protein
MKLLKTKTHVDNLRELRDRKAQLKTRLDTEQNELRANWQEVRANLQPSQIIANFAQSLFSGSAGQPGKEASGLAANLQGPLQIATDLLVGNARARLILRVVTPLFLTYLPALAKRAKGVSLDKSKAKLYGSLRKSVSGLRNQLKRKKAEAAQEIEAEDIVQPS